MHMSRAGPKRLSPALPLNRCMQVPAKVLEPKPYASAGLQYCGIDTGKPGTYTVTFTLTAGSGVRLSVMRTVVVLPSCSAGEQQCADGTCGGWLSRRSCVGGARAVKLQNDTYGLN